MQLREAMKECRRTCGETRRLARDGIFQAGTAASLLTASLLTASLLTGFGSSAIGW